jgi:hypothetical protein
MSRIKNMSRGGWIVIGIMVAILLVPSGVAVGQCAQTHGDRRNQPEQSRRHSGRAAPGGSGCTGRLISEC